MDHNAQTIIDEANATVASSGMAAAQNIYKSTLLDWVDDVTMGDTMEIDGGGIKAEVAELWLAYAKLNRGGNLVSLC